MNAYINHTEQDYTLRFEGASRGADKAKCVQSMNLITYLDSTVGKYCFIAGIVPIL